MNLSLHNKHDVSNDNQIELPNQHDDAVNHATVAPHFNAQHPSNQSMIVMI